MPVNVPRSPLWNCEGAMLVSSETGKGNYFLSRLPRSSVPVVKCRMVASALAKTCCIYMYVQAGRCTHCQGARSDRSVVVSEICFCTTPVVEPQPAPAAPAAPQG